ncbi:hypothetical protein QZH41_016009 [Actinostola sp. cb2023]|nr:hypothetical protein QZH41_016009 [Actinostola sp. cb2023]
MISYQLPVTTGNPTINVLCVCLYLWASCVFFSYFRGSRTHKGIDVKCPSGSTVYSPFPAKFIRIARPYGNGKPHDIGVLLVGTGQWSAYSVKMFYLSKAVDVNKGDKLGAGDQIGSMVNMAVQYGKCMTNHIHVKLYKNRKVVDPTNFFC